MGYADLPAQSALKADGRRVLMRVDLNVPMHEGRVTDDTRLRHIVPGIRDLLTRGAAVILISHFDRPNGRPVPAMSLRPIVASLSALLECPVAFADDCLHAGDAARALQPGQVLLLENLRFYPGEEANDPAFVATLASYGDAYVNDAFSVSHRAHASIVGLPGRLPGYAGFGTLAELKALDAVLHAPQRPVCAAVGGSKVSTKLALLNNLIEKVDMLMIGGAMANTFIAAAGISVGRSLYEPAMLQTAAQVQKRAERSGTALLLPVDAVVTSDLATAANVRTCLPTDVQPHEIIADIGPKTATLWARHLQTVRTLLWNGPFGAFEIAPFDAGTVAFARGAAEFTARGGISIAGGGDTASALNHAGVSLSYVSTAGGAFLECIEGRELPGITALRPNVVRPFIKIEEHHP